MGDYTKSYCRVSCVIWRDEASESQVCAANPSASIWLTANAGSGKTKVLIDRVALLLLDGVAPEHILCLTYTKAAASEMQNRLFRLLGDWSMKGNKDLYKELVQIGFDGAYDTKQLRHARTLFASAVETPGGLKIQTIHSFCAVLLRRFPLEAGVSVDFKEIEELEVKELCRDILQNLAASEHASLIESLARYGDEKSIEGLLTSLLRVRKETFFDANRSKLLEALGFSGDLDQTCLVSRYLFQDDIALIQKLSKELKSGGKIDQTRAEILCDVTDVSSRSLELLQQAFLKKSPPFALSARAISKRVKNGALANIMCQVDSLLKRVEEAKQASLAIFMADQTFALHQFAKVFFPTYELEKQVRGWLDFDDLIIKARDLLSNPTVADWVMYRLDGGVSHILVDEAQDTSPLQWEVIGKIAQEIISGEGARGAEKRTIFVVGDKKQSIYSFQGADANEFDQVKKNFEDHLAYAPLPLNEMSLDYSFRSSSAILKVVDKTFYSLEASGFSSSQKHIAFNPQMPGRVDLWPIVPAVNEASDREWYNPVDLAGKENHYVTLARQVAVFIKTVIDQKHPMPDELCCDGSFKARPIKAADFLILVQQRKELFYELIKACKALNLPIAGVDRLKVYKEMAVKDLVALLSFLALPEDDLSLAVALKSPLFGWREQRLFTLAHNRGSKYLWQAMCGQEKTYEEELNILRDLRGKVDFLRPYELLERILTYHEGRKKLTARLGLEAEDAINALLGQALSYEQTEIPSLNGFLQWIKVDDLEIKRQMENDGEQIRVMTVHGAKGLEAPIVLLPDTAKRDTRGKSGLLTSKKHAFWKTKMQMLPQKIIELQNEKKQKELQESDRLLYVAMTRAQKWLIVAAAGSLGNSARSWYEKVQAGMGQVGAVDQEFHGGVGKRFSFGNWDIPNCTPQENLKTPNASLPKWATQMSHKPVMPEIAIKPSDLGSVKTVPDHFGEDEKLTLRRGSQIHRLLEKLPDFEPSDRPLLATSILIKSGLANPDENVSAIIKETLDVLSSAELAFIFDQKSLAEVRISALLKEYDNRMMNGVIDRLIVTERDVFVVDYKTNRVVPENQDELPEGIYRQMGAYVSALKTIYPAHQIKPCILWTVIPSLMYLDTEKAISSMQFAPYA